MILVILYFFLVFLISLPIGKAVSIYLLRNSLSIICELFLGLLVITVGASIWMFFYPLSAYWAVILVSVSFLSMLVCRKELTASFKFLIVSWNKSTGLFKLIIPFIIIIIACCASLPAYVIDNDSYYVQTIKWLNQYGLVKGVSNIHFFLAQQSGLHILQSALNFDFLYDRWNDISAFYFLLGVLWSLSRIKNESPLLYKYRKGFLVLSLISLTFISAPSPDIPVYVLSYIIVYYFFKVWEDWHESYLLFMGLLCMQLAYFKVITVLMFVLVIMLLIKHHQYGRILIKIGFPAFIFTVLFITKNTIASGMPLYPLTTWSPVVLEWQMPVEIATMYKDMTVAQAYGLDYKTLQSLSFVERFKYWFNHDGVEGVLNKVTLLMFIVTLFFVFLRRKNKALFWLLLVFVIQSVALFMSSPQFRFFLNIMVPVAVLLFLITSKINNKLWRIITVSFLCIGFVLATSTQLNSLMTDNKLMKNRETLSVRNILEPCPVSTYSNQYHQIKLENLMYNSPVEDGFFFGTYDVPVPSVSNKYMEYIIYEYHLIPQLLGADISNGFKYIKIECTHNHKP